jgi:hypothetical protein
MEHPALRTHTHIVTRLFFHFTSFRNRLKQASAANTIFFLLFSTSLHTRFCCCSKSVVFKMEFHGIPFQHRVELRLRSSRVVCGREKRVRLKCDDGEKKWSSSKFFFWFFHICKATCSQFFYLYCVRIAKRINVQMRQYQSSAGVSDKECALIFFRSFWRLYGGVSRAQHLHFSKGNIFTISRVYDKWLIGFIT